MSKIKLPQLGWFDNKEVEFPLPNRWQVEMAHIVGYNRPKMKPAEIRAVLANPIGSKPIKELAKGKKDVVIIFDDMSRITRTSELVHYVLEELAEAGIEDKHIRFVCALGCHGALTRVDFVKKLGEDIMVRFPVYNHNPFGNYVPVGKTKTYGTEVFVNAEVMACDLKISIGMVVPHPMSGFGGGGKIILPGVSAFSTIQYNHHKTYSDISKMPDKWGPGKFDNPMRVDVEEAAVLAGLDFIISELINYKGEAVALFAGALKPTFAEAVKLAKTHYLSPAMSDKDIIISNTFIKGNEAFMGPRIANIVMNKKGGDVVCIANAPDGMIPHYLLGPFGDNKFGPEHQFASVPETVKRTIIYTEYPDLAGRGWFADSDKVVYVHKWDEVLKMLEADYPGAAKVGVYPNSEIQYCTG